MLYSTTHFLKKKNNEPFNGAVFRKEQSHKIWLPQRAAVPITTVVTGCATPALWCITVLGLHKSNLSSEEI